MLHLPQPKTNTTRRSPPNIPTPRPASRASRFARDRPGTYTKSAKVELGSVVARFRASDYYLLACELDEL
jgi:hypothetical protein